MPYNKQMIILLLLLQVMTSCWARNRYTPETWSAASRYWNDIEEFRNNDSSDSNSINESDLAEKFLPVTYKAKKALRRMFRFGNEERRKKLLAESKNLQDGHSLQGLWALPG